MAQHSDENPPATLELRFKRWTAVGIVCFLGLLAALPFRSHPNALSPTVAPSHRERSLRFRADSSITEPADFASERSEAPHRQTHREPAPSSQPKTPKTASPRQTPQAEVAGAEISTSASPPESTGESVWKSKESSLPPNSPMHCRAGQGENLMDIAERALGDRRRWRELMELNSQFRSSFDEIPEGTEIELPRSVQ